MKQYTLKEVSEHKDNRSTWLVIHNNVYDVTPFLNEHPGGEEVLLEQAGKEASDHFEDVGHSSDARDLMKKYQVGEIVDAEKKPVKEKKDWTAGTEQITDSDSSLKSWMLPLAIGIIATILYRFYFSS